MESMTYGHDDVTANSFFRRIAGDQPERPGRLGMNFQHDGAVLRVVTDDERGKERQVQALFHAHEVHDREPLFRESTESDIVAMSRIYAPVAVEDRSVRPDRKSVV